MIQIINYKNSNKNLQNYKYICLIGFILFIIGLIFIIVTFNKLNDVNIITNTTNNTRTVIASWGLLLIGISIFIITGTLVYICRYKSIPIEEPLLNIT